MKWMARTHSKGFRKEAVPPEYNVIFEEKKLTASLSTAGNPCRSEDHLAFLNYIGHETEESNSKIAFLTVVKV